MTTYPSTLAKYYKGGPVGILPGQSMFETDATREGLYEARSSFVRMLNIIFARSPVALERASAVDQMNVAQPVTEYLAWRRPFGTNQTEAVPPATMYDYQVFTLEERNRLLGDPEFVNAILSGEKPSVLVNGIGNEDTPQWSIYRADIPAGGPTPDYIASHPNEVFSLAKCYDEVVEDFHARDLLTQGVDPIAEGVRVLVEGNQSTFGFWTVWEYVGLSTGDSEVDAAGFKLIRYQTYNTADFWNYTDWYATGYAASSPPVVRYATQGARDQAENPVPSTAFVRIDDDGTGSWVWTAFTDGAWNVVARQNGTIALSSIFYTDPTRPTIGLDPISPNDIANFPLRDGSWEFKVLFNLLRDAPVLTNLEVNEVFFSMLHFVHAQQDQVSWAFKTSFLNVGGYNEALTQTPVEPIDNTQNLLNYLDEVKPYRVKTREFTRIVTPETDIANTSVSDFDFPLYYDENTAKYRVLNPSNAADLAIIQSTKPWKDWYDMYMNPVSAPSEYSAATWNGVRHMTLGINFDRVDHMPIIATEKFTYISGLPSANTFNLHIDTTVIDMRTEIVEVLIGERSLMSGEFTVDKDSVTVEVSMADGTIVTVNVRNNLTNDLAADRIQRFYDPTNTHAQEKNLRTLMGMNFKANIMDGGDLEDNSVRDYDLDGNANVANAGVETFNPNEHYFGLADPVLTEGRPEELIVAGTGESLNMFVQANWNMGAPEQTYRVFDTSESNGVPPVLYYGEALVQYRDGIAVFKDGKRATYGDDYTINFDTNEITMSAADANSVVIKTFGISAYTPIEDVEVFHYVSGPAVFPLSADYSGYVTTVTVDGVILTPGQYVVDNDSLTLNNEPVQPVRVMFVAQDTGQVNAPISSKVFFETLTYNGPQTWNLSNPSKPFTNEEEATIVEVDGLRLNPENQYTVANGVLHIVPSLSANSNITVTTFSDKDQLGIQTLITNATVSGNYQFDSPFGLSYIWMSMDGVYYDPAIPVPATGPPGTQRVVITQFRGAPTQRAAWAISMKRPATDLMAPKETGDFDARPLDTTLYDIGRVGGTATGSMRGDANTPVDRSIFVIRSDAFEYLKWDAGEGKLTSDVTPASNSITITPPILYQMPINPPVIELLATDDPTTGTMTANIAGKQEMVTSPGVVWINGERIEFFANTINQDGTITLSELRRGTHNTRICAEQRKVVSYTGDAMANAFIIPGESSLDGLVVSVFEPLRYPTGELISSDGYTGYNVLAPKTQNRDYTSTITNSGVVVSFYRPPDANTTVYLAISKGVVHKTGDVIHEGRNKLDIRPDRPFGGETNYQ